MKAVFEWLTDFHSSVCYSREFPFQLILYFLFYVSLDVQYFCYLSFRCVYDFHHLSIELKNALLG